MRSQLWAIRPKTVARAMPARVPRQAQTVFLSTPPRITKVAAVTSTEMRKVVGMVGHPASSRGSRIKISAATVRPRLTRLFTPTLPPTSTVTSRNAPTTTSRPGKRLYS